MKPKAEELPTRAPTKVRVSERRHNKSRRKRGIEKRGQCTPGYETLKTDSSQSLKCARCGCDIKQPVLYCLRTINRGCIDSVAMIQSALRKFPPLRRQPYRPAWSRNEPRF